MRKEQKEEPEIILNDVKVIWDSKRASSVFSDKIVTIQGGNVMVLIDPDDPEDRIVLPLNSGRILYVEVGRSTGIDE